MGDWRLLSLLLLHCCGTCLCAGGEQTCLSSDGNPYLLFATKSAYTFATNSRVQFNTNTLYDVPGCRATAIWLLARYGTELPQTAEYNQLHMLHTIRDNIIHNYNNGNFRDTQHRMCDADISALSHWSLPSMYNASVAGLTSEGYIALQRLAQAWRNRYPQLFTFNRYDYKFKFGKDYISSTSFRAFSEGIYGQDADSIDIPRDINDTLVMAHKHCKAWADEDGAAHDSQMTQLDIFRSKHEYKEMVSNISRRLGYKYDIDAVVVHHMYDMCAYDKAWRVREVSPWCAVFTAEDLQRLEYAEDLDTYYKYGYGGTHGRNLGCGLLMDMVHFFEERAKPNVLPQQPRVQVLLTDAAGIMSTLTALSAHRDHGGLTALNYHTAPVQNRKWRTSLMAPYTANMAAVLYKCGENLLSDEHKVLFVLNEQPMTLSNCHVGLCQLATVASIGRTTRCQQCTSHAANDAFIHITLLLTTFMLSQLL